MKTLPDTTEYAHAQYVPVLTSPISAAAAVGPVTFLCCKFLSTSRLASLAEKTWHY